MSRSRKHSKDTEPGEAGGTSFEPIEGRQDIRDSYRDQTVAEEYVDRRFSHPLGRLLHDRQVRALRRVVNDLRPASVLEIAPGPGRLTVETARFIPRGGIAIDASPDMLEVAQRRLRQVRAEGKWQFLLGDAFSLPFRSSSFDLIYSFRFIRHFRREERARLFAGISHLLRPGGLLVFDAVNEVVSSPLREKAEPGEYQHFDALMNPQQILVELEEASLEPLQLEGIQRRYGLLHRLQTLVGPRSESLTRFTMEVVERLGGGEPLEWVVTCRRR